MRPSCATVCDDGLWLPTGTTVRLRNWLPVFPRVIVSSADAALTTDRHAMLSQPTRPYTIFIGVVLLLQGSVHLLPALPAVRSGVSLLLEMTRMIPAHSLLHIATAVVAFWLYFWGGPRGRVPVRAILRPVLSRARGRGHGHGTSSRPWPASVRSPVPLCLSAVLGCWRWRSRFSVRGPRVLNSARSMPSRRGRAAGSTVLCVEPRAAAATAWRRAQRPARGRAGISRARRCPTARRSRTGSAGIARRTAMGSA